MAFKLPTIKLGSQVLGKSKFDMSHDANTTLNFGFVNCQTVLECIPNTKTVMEVNSLVRLAPMVVPSTTRILYKTFHQFVPFSDLYEPFENLYAEQKYGTASSNYVPTSVPVISTKILCSLLFHYGWFSAFDLYNGAYRHIPNPATVVLNAYCDFFTSAGGGFVYSNQWTPNPNPPFEELDENIVSPNGADFIFEHEYNGSTYLFTIRLNNVGKRIRSILLGCGYNLDPTNTINLSAMPLFAFYKAYFDLFQPQRYVSWTNTGVYQLLDKVRVNNAFNLSNTYYRELTDLFELLGETFYTDNVDFPSAHIPKPSVHDNTQNVQISSPNNLSMRSELLSEANGKLYNGVSSFSADTVRALLKLSSLQNISTAIGGRIKDFMKVMTGSSELHNKDSYHIGHTSVEIQVEDVNNTASIKAEGSDEMVSAYLGEYAGKGYARKGNMKFSYENKTFGYWVMLNVIVPVSDYFQGLAPHLFHRTTNEFYKSPFDGLGFEVTPQSQIMNDQSVTPKTITFQNNGFGFVPRMSSYKYHQNVVSGNLSLRSTKASYLPYTIDKYITPRDFTARMVYSGGIKLENPKFTTPNIPIASIEWRYINKYPWLSNYQRIFPTGVLNTFTDGSSSIDDDPFFAFNYLKVTQFSHMKPISESFETEGEGDHTVDVQKA